jgi:hypothetical protein
MNLSSPITITPPSITKKDGTVKNFNPITLNSLDVVLIDSSSKKIVVAQIRPCPRPLVLWENEAYDSIGDYTQNQAENRILELLGDNPTETLQNLFVVPNRD